MSRIGPPGLAASAGRAPIIELTERDHTDTDFCMKTTLNFDDRLIRAAKARAAEDGESLTKLIERALRDYHETTRPVVPPYRLELLIKGGAPVEGVDLDDRDKLYERMEEQA